MGHLAMLRRGVHHSALMQQDYQVHGDSAFAVEVLEKIQCVSRQREAMLKAEDKWTRELKPEYGGALTVEGYRWRNYDPNAKRKLKATS